MPGILALDIHSADTSKILTGGADKNATVFNKDTEQVVAILKGHTKKVRNRNFNCHFIISLNILISFYYPPRLRELFIIQRKMS